MMATDRKSLAKVRPGNDLLQYEYDHPRILGKVSVAASDVPVLQSVLTL